MDEKIKTEDLPQDDKPTKDSVQVDSGPSHHMALSDHFSIEFPTKADEKKLAEIWEYGKGLSKTGEVRDIMWQVMHLTRTLGAPKLGEKSIDRVYRWAKLKRQERDIQEELKNV